MCSLNIRWNTAKITHQEDDKYVGINDWRKRRENRIFDSILKPHLSHPRCESPPLSPPIIFENPFNLIRGRGPPVLLIRDNLSALAFMRTYQSTASASEPFTLSFRKPSRSRSRETEEAYSQIFQPLFPPL